MGVPDPNQVEESLSKPGLRRLIDQSTVDQALSNACKDRCRENAVSALTQLAGNIHAVLTTACIRGFNQATVSTLLGHGANVNMPAEPGWSHIRHDGATKICLAAYKCNQDVVQLLLQ